MSETESAAGGVLMVGFEGLDLDRPTAALLERISPAGVILFRRNLDTPERLARLHAELREVLPGPRLFALDQEGGRVSRLEPWIGETPTAAALARAGGSAAYRFGRATGAALASLGFNLDFAPVVDLCPGDARNGIGERSFGTDPLQVAGLAGSFLEGLQAEGVAGCLKHFPGLGDTTVDSHVELPVCDRELERLESEDLAPYRSLAAQAACVMVGHASYPALDAVKGCPASLSPVVVTRLLRERIGYQGLIVADDLEMGAVAPRDLDGSAAVAAVAAGCDLVPYCSDLERAERARRALAREAAADASFSERLLDAARRVARTAARWPLRRPDLSTWDSRRAELQRAASSA